MKDTKKQYVGLWVPACVMLDPRLKDTDKLMLGYLGSFGPGKTCRQGNDTMAINLGWSEKKVEKVLTRLRKLGFFKRRIFPVHDQLLPLTRKKPLQNEETVPQIGGSTPQIGGSKPLKLEDRDTIGDTIREKNENSPASPGNEGSKTRSGDRGLDRRIGAEGRRPEGIEDFLDGLGFEGSVAGDTLDKLEAAGWLDPEGLPFPEYPRLGNVFSYAEGLAKEIAGRRAGAGPKARSARPPGVRNLHSSAFETGSQFMIHHTASGPVDTRTGLPVAVAAGNGW